MKVRNTHAPFHLTYTAIMYTQPLQLAQLHRRGPDAVSSLDVEVGSSLVGLHGTVLHMRGPLTRQPLVSQNGDALLWNGEVYDGLKVTVAHSLLE